MILARALCVLLAFLVSVSAQQLEPNTPGGTLTSGGVSPVPAQPFLVTFTETLDLEILGAATSPYLLALGSLANPSVSLAPLGLQFLDIAAAGFTVVGSGFGGPSLLPSGFFVTNPIGASAWSFPANAGLNGQRFAFQAAVADAASVGGLNLTAAGEFEVTSSIVLGGSEAVGSFTFPSGPYQFYGTSFTGIEVSTNGWVRFGPSGSLAADGFPGVNKLVGGFFGDPLPPIPGLPLTVPPTPGVAVYWDQLDFSAGQVVINEASPGVTSITWIGGRAPLSSNVLLGSFSCLIDNVQGAIILDYTAFTAPPGIPSGTNPILGLGGQAPLVGVSSGPIPGTVTARDLVLGGSVNSFAAPGPVQTLYQDFSGATPPPAAEAVDLVGQILTFFDASSNRSGAFALF